MNKPWTPGPKTKEPPQYVVRSFRIPTALNDRLRVCAKEIGPSGIPVNEWLIQVSEHQIEQQEAARKAPGDV